MKKLYIVILDYLSAAATVIAFSPLVIVSLAIITFLMKVFWTVVKSTWLLW